MTYEPPDAYDPDEPVSEDDQVYMDRMDRTRVYIAAAILMVGFIISWPLIPGANWVDHQVFAPVIHWWQSQSGRATYRYGSGVVVMVLVTWSGIMRGWRVAALRGVLLMAGFFILTLFLY